MSGVEVLVGAGLGDDAVELTRLYTPPTLPWMRASMVSTVDGSATGPDGTSGSINNDADQQAYRAMRSLAEAIIVGAGTARAEEYGPGPVPIVVASRSGDLPPTLAEAEPGQVLLATVASAAGLEPARKRLGEENVLVLGETEPDLGLLRRLLVDRGYRQLMAEGGPQLLAELLRAGVVDELDLTLSPLLVCGDGPRIAVGAEVEAELELIGLVRVGSTLLGRWRILH